MMAFTTIIVYFYTFHLELIMSLGYNQMQTNSFISCKRIIDFRIVCGQVAIENLFFYIFLFWTIELSCLDVWIRLKETLHFYVAFVAFVIFFKSLLKPRTDAG